MSDKSRIGYWFGGAIVVLVGGLLAYAILGLAWQAMDRKGAAEKAEYSAAIKLYYEAEGATDSRQYDEKMGEAIKQFKDLNLKRPEKGEYLMYLGELYAKSGEIDQAIDCLESSLKKSPRLHQAEASLGAIYHKKGLTAWEDRNLAEAQQNLQIARAKYEKAIKMSPVGSRFRSLPDHQKLNADYLQLKASVEKDLELLRSSGRS